MLRTRVVMALIAGLLAFVSPAGPANAATVIQKDKVGDAAARFDILRVTYTNNSRAFAYRMKLDEISRDHGILAFPKLLINGRWNRFFVVRSGVRRDGSRFHRLLYVSPDEYRHVPCSGMTGGVNFAKDVVTARVPQACLAALGQRRYRVVGYVAGPRALDAADSVRFRWVNFN